MTSFITLLLTLAVFNFGMPAVHGEIHAVLVAGSKGWSNYRHQADIAHAYKLLTEGGIKKANIVTMMYDDVAHSWRNPYKGKLYNRPANTTEEAVDVYAAIKDNIDYTGVHVNPKNFLSVLQGEAGHGGSRRTLNSTDQDDVFVYFADHGAPGNLAFPGLLPIPAFNLLSADKLNAALVTAHGKKLFKRLVFYTEACESGSIFDGLLPKNISVYAVTAANAKESSWGWYCDQDSGSNKVMGKTMGVCLGDMFSIKWMEDSDFSNRALETLAIQYQRIKSRVTKSHVSHFGDLSIALEPLEDYQGKKTNASIPISSYQEEAESRPLHGGVSSRDAELKMLQWQLSEAEAGNPLYNLTVSREQLQAELASRERADKAFKSLWDAFHQGESLESMNYKPPRDFACLEVFNAAVQKYLGGYTDYSLGYMKVGSNLCETGIPPERITAALKRACL